MWIDGRALTKKKNSGTSCRCWSRGAVSQSAVLTSIWSSKSWRSKAWTTFWQKLYRLWRLAGRKKKVVRRLPWKLVVMKKILGISKDNAIPPSREKLSRNVHKTVWTAIRPNIRPTTKTLLSGKAKTLSAGITKSTPSTITTPYFDSSSIISSHKIWLRKPPFGWTAIPASMTP